MVFAFRPERASYSGPRHRLGDMVDNVLEPYRGGIRNYEFRITNYDKSSVVHHLGIVFRPQMRLIRKAEGALYCPGWCRAPALRIIEP